MGENEARDPCLSGPETVRLTAVQPWGPLADRAGARLLLPSLEISLRNPGPETVVLEACELEPLRSAADGGSVPATLSAELPDGRSWPESLAAGRVGTLQLGGGGRLPPGHFDSRLALSGGGRTLASFPVQVTVRAHWLWAFGSVLLGLAFLGLLLLLAGRASLNEKLAEVLSEQQALGEMLEGAPPTLGDLPLARQAQEAVDAALESLARPRPIGLEDPRLARAEEYLEEARAARAALRERTGDRSPGQLAVAALDTEWLELGRRLESTRRTLAPEAVPSAGAGGLAPRLLAVQSLQWQQRLEPLLLAIESGLGPHVERTGLALAAGEQERARQLAQTVAVWLRRAARQLDWEVGMLLTWRAFAGEMLTSEWALRRALADPAFPAAVRQRLERSLETAYELLEDTSLEGFRAAAAELQRAETRLAEARRDRLLEQVAAVIAAVEARTSLERIEAALDALPAEDPPEAKSGRLLGILSLWHERVATVEEAELREELEGRVVALERLVEADDLEAAGPAFGELLEAWIAYQDAETAEATAEVIVPHCRQQQPALRSQRLAAVEALALLLPHPDLAGLDAELDRIGAEIEVGFADAVCLDRLVELSEELLEVGDLLFITFLKNADISPEERLAQAEYSEVAEAAALARRLMQGPRPLRLELRTPAAEVRVDRTVTFETGDLDPAWGPGTSIRIDFGDGTPATVESAEQLRQEPLLRHSYPRPQRAVVRLVAARGTAEEVAAGRIFEAEGEVLGEATRSITVLPSPISLARSLAGFFLSARFALALALGLLIQGWRLYDERPFGSRPRDYLEAFALGVGIQGLVEGLSAALVQLASGG